VIERGPGERCAVRLGESVLEVAHGCPDVADHTHAVIRPERIRIEEYGPAGVNRVPAMVERLVYLGSSTQVILRLAAGAQLNVLLQNDGTGQTLSQGTPRARLPGAGRAARPDRRRPRRGGRRRRTPGHRPAGQRLTGPRRRVV